MLLIDGVKYQLWTPEKEEDLEAIVKEHFQEIFGQDAVFFDKSKLQTHFKEATIPDGYIIHLGKTPGWSILEVELSKHDLHDHITTQLNKFIDAIKNSQNRQKIIQELNATIRTNAILKEDFKAKLGDREIYEFLTQVVSQEPTLVVVIEKETQELKSAIDLLKLLPKTVELKTYVREGVGLAVHAHLFEPISPPAIEGKIDDVRIVTRIREEYEGGKKIKEILTTSSRVLKNPDSAQNSPWSRYEIGVDLRLFTPFSAPC